MSNNQSRCMYCGSTSYGSGCIFSSHRMHIHVDDPTRCIYCGMMAYGSGCIFNPFTKMHIHGVDVGQTVKETVRKTVELSYITDRLLEQTKSTLAYKAGLIDDRGNLIRPPSTPYEQRLVSPLSRLLENLKKYITTDSQTIVESLKLLSASSIETAEEYKSKLQIEHDLTHIIRQLKTIINKGVSEISLEKLEEAIESSILKSLDDQH